MNQDQRNSVEQVDKHCEDFLNDMPTEMIKEDLEILALKSVKLLQEANQIIASQRDQVDWFSKTCLLLIDYCLQRRYGTRKERQELSELKKEVLRVIT